MTSGLWDGTGKPHHHDKDCGRGVLAGKTVKQAELPAGEAVVQYELFLPNGR